MGPGPVRGGMVLDGEGGSGWVVCAAPDAAPALGYDVGAALKYPDDP